MSRGGRGGFGRGRGRGGGRGGFGAGNLPPMGLTFADIQSLSREGTALYPTMDSLPTMTTFTDDEKKICDLQIGFASRMRKSPYYLVETTRSTDLPRYSDKYRPSVASQPTLKRKDLHQPFFPPDIFDAHFNPKKRKKVEKKTSTKRMNLDDLAEDEEEEQEKSSDERSEAGSQADASDYEAEEDDDYAENYFDNGEGDDNDELGPSGFGDDGGGGDYD